MIYNLCYVFDSEVLSALTKQLLFQRMWDYNQFFQIGGEVLIALTGDNLIPTYKKLYCRWEFKNNENYTNCS